MSSKATFGVEHIDARENIFGDDIASVHRYDFSRANMSNEKRIHAITAVASVCYHNDKVIDKESLYNRLATEARGLPSSSFEFVPVLLTVSEVSDVLLQLDSEEVVECFENGRVTIDDVVTSDVPIIKYGEWVEYDGSKYLITNFRAITSLYEIYAIDLRDRYNTAEECEIIKNEYFVFLFNIDIATRSQLVRHRVNLQELSRRYVSGNKKPFEVYVSENMKDMTTRLSLSSSDSDSDDDISLGYDLSTTDLIKLCLRHYNNLLNKGVKPQDARRIIPYGAYTRVWAGFTKRHLNNYLELRLDVGSQWEIRQTAIAIKDMLVGSDG